MTRNLAVICALVIAGCSSSSTIDQDASWNQADQKFVQEMIPHHEQALSTTQVLIRMPAT